MTLREFPKVEQGSDEWHTLRRGIITASDVGKLLTFARPDAIEFPCPECAATVGLPCASLRGGKPITTLHGGRREAAAAADTRLVIADNDTSQGLVASKAAERIAGFTDDTPMTSDMWRGVEAEPFAREEYGKHHAEAIEYGFMIRDEGDWLLGYSPDGMVGDDGLIEIKAPRTKTHVRTVLADEVPSHYMAQCQAALLVSGRSWLDFIPYVAGLPMWVKRVWPDPEWHAAIVAAATTFETNVSALVDDYTKRVEGLPVTERIDFNALGLEFS